MAAVKVDIGRASIVAIVVAILLFGALTAGGVYAGLDTTDTMTRIIGFVFAGLFGLGLLVCLLALPKAIQPRGFVFDADGIHHWHGTTWTRLPWQDVAAVGIGYSQPPDVPSLPLSIEDAVKDFVMDKAKAAMHLDSKRRFGMEIFPAGPEALERYPALAQYRKELTAPAAGLAQIRWRIPLPPVLGTVATVERGMRAHREAVWLGWYAHPWKRI